MPTLTGDNVDKKPKSKIQPDNVDVYSRYELPDDMVSSEIIDVMTRHAYGRNILHVIRTSILNEGIKAPTDSVFGKLYSDIGGAYHENNETYVGRIRRYLPPEVPLSKSRIETMYFVPLKMWAKKNPHIKSDVERAKRYLEYKKNGKLIKPRMDYLSWICSAFKAMIVNDFDVWIGVVGYEGTGKSAFALGLARYLGYYGFKFNPLTNIFFSSTPVDYIIDLMENTEEQVFIFDEASAFFDNRNSQKADQKRLIQTMIMNRARRHVVILCTPDIKGIDVKLRERRVTTIFQLLDRNHFALLLKHTIGQTGDGFMYSLINKKILSKQDQSTYSLIHTMLNIPTCYGVFRTSGMLVSKATYNFYKKMKMELNKISAGEVAGATSPTTLIYDFLAYVIRRENAIINNYSKLIGIDPSILNSMLKMVIPKKSKLRADSVVELYKEFVDKTKVGPSQRGMEEILQGKEKEGPVDKIVESALEQREEEYEDNNTELTEEDIKEALVEELDHEVLDEIEEQQDDTENLPKI